MQAFYKENAPVRLYFMPVLNCAIRVNYISLISDAILHRRTSVPNHYFNNCWNIVDWTLRNNFKENLNKLSELLFNKLHLNSVNKTATILFMPQCVNCWIVLQLVFHFHVIPVRQNRDACQTSTFPRQLHTRRHIPYDIAGLIVGLRPTNERRRYKVTPSLIGWAQTYWNNHYLAAHRKDRLSHRTSPTVSVPCPQQAIPSMPWSMAPCLSVVYSNW